VENVGFLKDVTQDGVNSLRSAALELVPSLARETVAATWAGLRPFVADGLPVIGRVEEFKNLFVATGHYRNGILLAPLTAQLIANLVMDGTVDPEAEIFSPERLKKQRTATPS
jgi:glycine/D-amino acid oxidase-like deaminating enzyme